MYAIAVAKKSGIEEKRNNYFVHIGYIKYASALANETKEENKYW